MKKYILIIVCNLLVLNNVFCQKFAYVDSDYILSKMPEFSQAQSKIDEISKDFETLKRVSEKAVIKVRKDNHIDKLVNDLYHDYKFLLSK